MRADVISEQNDRKNSCKGLRRKRLARKDWCFLLVMALAIPTFFGFVFYYIEHKKPDVNDVLSEAGLAELPESIKDLKIDTRPFIVKNRAIFNRRLLFIRFQAEPNSIDKYISNSTCIDKSSFHPLVALYGNQDEAPSWWYTDQTTPGRIYYIPEQKNTIGGTVAVYDDSNTVRLAVYFVVNPKLRKLLDRFW